MLDFLPWRPFQAVAWDVLQTASRRIPGGAALRNLLLQPPPAAGIPVFVMLPLDAALPSPTLPPAEMEAALHKLASAGVHGVMADVWWGLCEKAPGTYDFASYIDLFRRCREAGLRVQATMSFHACGGNVGDFVNIPLPEWVEEAGDRHGFWFKDRAGDVNKEYISFGADHEPLLPSLREEEKKEVIEEVKQAEKWAETAKDAPSAAGQFGALGMPEEGSPPEEPEEKQAMRPRTPLQAYSSFVRAFVEAMDEEGLLGSTITELQIGLGPSGELRYPSYPMKEGKWEFPGIGEFQCFDKYLLKDLKETVRERGSEAVKKATMPPANTGKYNDKPKDTEFFTKGFRSAEGKFFLEWYSSRMLEHGEDVLKQVRTMIPAAAKHLALAVKVSGVHWWKFSASRAAEATAGYIMAPGKTAYVDIARLLRSNGAVLDFTCLEMRTIDQPFLKARCAPRQLVSEVFRAAKKEGVAVAGENALERYDWNAYAQVASAFRKCGANRHGFTLLRLGKTLLEDENLDSLAKFVSTMKRI